MHIDFKNNALHCLQSQTKLQNRNIMTLFLLKLIHVHRDISLNEIPFQHITVKKRG